MSEQIAVLYFGTVLLLILVVGLIIRKIGKSEWAIYQDISRHSKETG